MPLNQYLAPILCVTLQYPPPAFAFKNTKNPSNSGIISAHQNWDNLQIPVAAEMKEAF
ncbi:hypothetical protein Nos7107_0882 [Nostoc sp. PCC 7107]|nr:hypothetical protein Nos7107_0882 [Nostoc sp. PCC 7107]